MQTLSAVRAARRAPVLQLLKTAIATVGAWLLCAWIFADGPPPVFASIAALLVVQPSVSQSYFKAIERSAGVIVGVVIATLFAWAIPSPAWSLPLAVVAALAVAWAARMTAGTTNQVVISALLVIALGSSTPGYAVDRVVETIIGAALGFVVNVAFVPPVAVPAAKDAIDALGEELAVSLERLADALPRALDRPQREELLITARLLRPMRESANEAIAAATDSLALNPRGRGHRERLQQIVRLRDRFDPVVTQTVGMTRTYYDRYDDALATDPMVPSIAEQLRRSAHDVRFLVRQAGQNPADPPTTSIPALTRPLQVMKPTGDHWVLIGSLLEDLRRVNAELTEEDDPDTA